MELREYLGVARRRWKLILGFVTVAFAFAALVAFQSTPQYSSQARLFFATSPKNNSEAYQIGLFSEQRVASYADLATGQELSRRVIDRLDLDMTPSELTQKTSTSVVPDTVILRVTVTDPAPRKAQRLSQAVAEELSTVVSEVEAGNGKDDAPIEATIVEPAALPETPDSPQPARYLGIAVVFGLLLGLGAAVLRELLDSTVKSREDVSGAAGAPVIGAIPYDPGAAKRPFVTALANHAPRVEAFRVLGTNLQFINADAGSKVFVVTSSVRGVGKTTSAINLAITLAQADHHVLLVEADLRRPQIPAWLDLDTPVGLTTVLAGRIALEDAVQPSGVENLSVLAGAKAAPNPVRLFQSPVMSYVIKQARQAFDIVILNAPPLLPVADAAMLTTLSDGAVIIARHGQTTKDQLRQSRDRLDAVDGRLLGMVLNFVPKRGASTHVDSHEEYEFDEGLDNAERRTATKTDEAESSPDAVGFRQPGRHLRAAWK